MIITFSITNIKTAEALETVDISKWIMTYGPCLHSVLELFVAANHSLDNPYEAEGFWLVWLNDAGAVSECLAPIGSNKLNIIACGLNGAIGIINIRHENFIPHTTHESEEHSIFHGIITGTGPAAILAACSYLFD